MAFFMVGFVRVLEFWRELIENRIKPTILFTTGVNFCLIKRFFFQMMQRDCTTNSANCKNCNVVNISKNTLCKRGKFTCFDV